MVIAKAIVKSVSLAEMKDKFIGKAGTTKRDKYEYAINIDVLKFMTKKASRKLD